MRISIVTPSFNQARFLSRTLDSILSQTGEFELECLVMDGGSTDGSIEIIKAAEKRAATLPRVLFYWQSSKDKGQSDAINQGLQKATGDVVAWLNSDDVYRTGTLQTVAMQFTHHPHRLWLSGYCRIINSDDRPVQSVVMRYKNWWLKHYRYRTLLALNYICQPATFWRRSILDEVGLLNEQLRYTMDYDLWLRFGRRHNLLIVRQVLADFRVHPASKGGNQYVWQFAEDYATAKRYIQNPLILGVHSLHNGLITTLYRFIK